MAAPVLQPLGSRQQGFRARTGQEARLGLGSFFGGLKPTPAAGFRVPTYTPALRNAKKFWDHFVFRRRSDSQSILPITNNQVQQDTCRTLPFLQSVVHENCEKVVLKNNLCFGKCSSVNVPGNEDGLHTFCSYCFPAKFTRKMVQLKCQDSLQVTKVVMMVEECQCEVQKERPSHQNGPFLMDPSLVRNQT
ncbi:CER1 protein, partial [Amia calva]|nr:CER1 protein [Amia calva]